MTCQIGEELDKETSVITLAAAGEGPSPRVLDIGMAPGGFSKTVLRTHPKARIRGITLPLEIGGIKMMLPGWQTDHRVRMKFLDVTMLADEMGRPTTSIPTDHTDFAKFSSRRPFKKETFDLVFCGATVRYVQARAEYRESHERTRLVTSQLVVALQRLRQRGSLVLVMHKVEAINTAEIIRTFTKCSKVRLFKPEKKFAIKSSFYMVAMEVDTENKDLQSAILKWQKQWEDATFEANNALPACSPASEDQVREMLTEFGPRLIELATPLWKTQADALRSSPFLK
jgi:23S rRNA U2552 (ribose-2'-O)-methylase RlmE/FtsJ